MVEAIRNLDFREGSSYTEICHSLHQLKTDAGELSDLVCPGTATLIFTDFLLIIKYKHLDWWKLHVSKIETYMKHYFNKPILSYLIYKIHNGSFTDLTLIEL